MSSLPQRPQLESFCEASLMAAALTVMVIGSAFPPVVIPGRRGAASPESIATMFSAQSTALGLWVPGSARSRGPGTTASEIHLVAALEHQDLARLVGRRDLH